MCRRFDCRKKDYRLVKKLAEKFAEIIKENTRLFYSYADGIKIYDFEPAELNQHIETTIEIIKI